MTVDDFRKFLESIGLNIQIPGYGQLLVDAHRRETEKMICPKANEKDLSKLQGKEIFQCIVDEPSKIDTDRFFSYASKVINERHKRDRN